MFGRIEVTVWRQYHRTARALLVSAIAENSSCTSPSTAARSSGASDQRSSLSAAAGGQPERSGVIYIAAQRISLAGRNVEHSNASSLRELT